jgi:hypothetical protein
MSRCRICDPFKDFGDRVPHTTVQGTLTAADLCFAED